MAAFYSLLATNQYSPSIALSYTRDGNVNENVCARKAGDHDSMKDRE